MMTALASALIAAGRANHPNASNVQHGRDGIKDTPEPRAGWSLRPDQRCLNDSKQAITLLPRYLDSQ